MDVPFSRPVGRRARRGAGLPASLGCSGFRTAAVGHKAPIREVCPKTTCLPEKMIRAASRSVRDRPVLAAK